MRPQSLVRTVLVALVLAVGAAGGWPFTHQATAQDATPAFPLEPDPSLCTIEPVDADALLADAFASPVATPGTSDTAPAASPAPVGQLVADPELRDAIAENVLQFYSCLEAGDVSRALGVLTTDLAAVIGPGTLRLYEADYIRPPMILGVTDLERLEDGRVRAVVTDALGPLYLTVEQVDGRWLVDEVIDPNPAESCRRCLRGW